jgi:hypothetical protein
MKCHGFKGEQMEGIERERQDIRLQLVGGTRTGFDLSAIQAGKFGGGDASLNHVAPFPDEPEAVFDDGRVKGFGFIGVEFRFFADFSALRAVEIAAERCRIGLQPIGDQPCVVLAEPQFLSASRTRRMKINPFSLAEEERPKG